MALPASAPPAYVYRSSGAVISLTSCLPAPLAAVAAAAASPVAPLLLLLLLGLLRRTPLTAAVVAAAAPRRCCCHYHTCVASHRSLAASSSFPSPPRRLPLPPSPPPGSLVPVVVDARSCSPPPRRALACWISFDLQQSTMAIQAIGQWRRLPACLPLCLSRSACVCLCRSPARSPRFALPALLLSVMSGLAQGSSFVELATTHFGMASIRGEGGRGLDFFFLFFLLHSALRCAKPASKEARRERK